MLRTPKQNRQLHLLMAELKLDTEMKQDLAFQFSNGRTKSTRELDVLEFENLNNHLRAIKKGLIKPPEQKQPTEAQKADKKRKAFLAVCYDLGWTKHGKLDWDKINNWLTEYGYLHKKLNDYTLAELQKLISQVEKILQKDYAKRKI